MTVGEKIKLERKKVNITQKQLAEKLNLAIITVQQYERGVRQPSFEMKVKLAEALDLSVYTFLDEQEKEVYWSAELGMVKSSVDSGYTFSDEEKIIVDFFNNRLDDDGRKTLLKTANTSGNVFRLSNPISIEMLDTEKILKDSGLADDPCILIIDKFCNYMEMLNDEGQKEALKRVEELTEIPKYQAAEEDDE